MRTSFLLHRPDQIVALLAFSAGSLNVGLPSLRAADEATRIINFSARAQVGTGDQTLILGFGVDAGSNTFLLRGVGPSLRAYGVTGALEDPKLALFSGSQQIASDDNGGAAAVSPAAAAFPLVPGGLDAALLRPLDRGVYTAHVTRQSGSAGVGLAEVYDTGSSTSGRLVNASARAFAGTGQESFITGFIVAGTRPKTVLLRALGPALAGAGVGNTLSDPRLELYGAGELSPLATNDNWGGTGLLRTAVTQSGGLALASDSKDAALLLNLQPGVYTARISGTSGGTGVALFELVDSPIARFPLTTARNVIYQHGDTLSYDSRGTYNHPDGSKTVVSGGWFTMEIVDEGVTHPLRGNMPVMTLIETLLYEGSFVLPNGLEFPIRVVGYPTRRYYVQDAAGSILYQGENVPEGTTATGAPAYRTYWFTNPQDYIQYVAPLVVGVSKTTGYTKTDVGGTTQKHAEIVARIEDLATAATPLGNFDSYRIRVLVTSLDTSAVTSSRVQYVYPDVGTVKFEFYPTTPGDTGMLTSSLLDTNIPYLGEKTYPLAQGNRLTPVAAGQVTRFNRSGRYVDDDGTIEDITGWFTMEALDEGVINPSTRRNVLTLLETHHTETTATDLAGNVTHSTLRQVFRRYCERNAAGQTAFVGDTGPNGGPIWFDRSFVPLTFPYSIGQAKVETVTASLWSNGIATPVFSYTPSMRVVSTVPVHTPLGTFECYRMSYQDDMGYLAEQYTYPVVGVVRFRYPAPAGKSGHVDVTLTSTNIVFP